MTILRSFARAADPEVVEAFCRDRSEAAASELIERHSPRLPRTVAPMLGDLAGDAEDVLQERWVQGFAAIGQFRGDAVAIS